MTKDFETWLQTNGLVEEFTTTAGDSFYTNREKKFGVLRKKGELGVHSFYLDDMISIRLYDDEKMVARWNKGGTWEQFERSTMFSTNRVYMKIGIANQLGVTIQIFKGLTGNIKRNTVNHANLIHYANQIFQVVYQCAVQAQE